MWPAQRAGNLGARRCRRRATFLSNPRVAAPPPAAASHRRSSPPQQGAQARSCSQARRSAGPRGRARPCAGAALPHRPPPSPVCRGRPLAPQPACPLAHGGFLGKVALLRRGGLPCSPPPQRRRRPFRPPRGKAQPAAPLFYLPGVFARTLLNRSLFPSRACFLSFFPSSCSPARALFPLTPPALARSRPPSCWARRSGAAGSSPRPPPPALRRRRRQRRSALRLIPIWHGCRAHAPALPPPPNPRSSRLPAPLAQRARRPPARPLQRRPLVVSPNRGLVGCGGLRGLRCWVSSAASQPLPCVTSPQLAADTPKAAVQGTQQCLRSPTALQPHADQPRRGDVTPGIQRPP